MCPKRGVSALKILVTGGAGYIGSHTALALLEAGHDVAIVDNLSNSKASALAPIQDLAGRRVIFHQVDSKDGQHESVGGCTP